MAGDHVTASADAESKLATYLGDLARYLYGPRRRREAILAELRDGLDEATADHTDAGLPADRAADAAIAEFGGAQAVADSFAGELSTAYARRTIAWFIATGPLVGIWWLLLLQPQPWRTGLIGLLIAISVVPLIAIAVATAAATLATTGRLMRWLPESSPHRAIRATIAVAAICLVADVTVIAMFGLSPDPMRPLAAVAIAASASRIICSAVTLRQATWLRRP
jgi:hypothetical protein